MKENEYSLLQEIPFGYFNMNVIGLEAILVLKIF